MKVTIPQDPDWKVQRLKRWNKVWEYGLRIDGLSKQDEKIENDFRAAKKVWYLEGDLAPLVAACNKHKMSEDIGLKSVLKFCPIVDVENYLEFIQKHSNWLSERSIDLWSPAVKDRDDRFASGFFHLYINENLDSTPAIFEHMLKMLLPDDNGWVTFPMKLGVDGWQPRQQVALCDCASDILKRLQDYLFGDEYTYLGYSHVVVALECVKYIQDLNPKYFDTVLIEGRLRPPPPPPTPRVVGSAGQQLRRAAFGNLLGYKSGMENYEGPLRHNDPAVEQQLRALIESLPMPPEYHRLIEFIHAHPDDYVTRSE